MMNCTGCRCLTIAAIMSRPLSSRQCRGYLIARAATGCRVWISCAIS